MESNLTVRFDFSQPINALNRMSAALLEASRLTNKEVYIINKWKRGIHAIEVHKRKLRKKYGR